LAGPVVACACLIPANYHIEGVRDSKLLTPRARKKLFWNIISETTIGIGSVDEREIDRINILNASLLAMKKAVLALPRTPDLLFIDGHLKIKLPIDQVPVVGGDQKLISVASASIVAKVVRDELMVEFDRTYPSYGFSRHKGYPTREHVEALRTNGPSPIHRRSFRPVGEVIASRLEKPEAV